MTPKRRSTIRRSTKTDLASIRTWLVDEDARGVHGNFLCNWNVIERAHDRRRLLVYIDGKTSLPAAFQLGGLLDSGILQVKSEFRGLGIGRKMVERCIALARAKNECMLYIQCKPSTSVPFWQAMGFTLIEGDWDRHAIRYLETPLPLPEIGIDVPVVVTFYPEEKKWEPDTVALQVIECPGRKSPDGVVHLNRRILFHEMLFPNTRDVVVRIEVDGIDIYSDKAKYEASRKIGINCCHNGFYLDKIMSPPVVHSDK